MNEGIDLEKGQWKYIRLKLSGYTKQDCAYDNRNVNTTIHPGRIYDQRGRASLHSVIIINNFLFILGV